jgi:uncharacterized membrane protein YvlD (DUF360 family)
MKLHLAYVLIIGRCMYPMLVCALATSILLWILSEFIQNNNFKNIAIMVKSVG